MDSFYEISFTFSVSLLYIVQSHTDDARLDCRDPLEILIEAEEELQISIFQGNQSC